MSLLTGARMADIPNIFPRCGLSAGAARRLIAARVIGVADDSCWRKRPDGARFFSRLKEGLTRSTQKLTEGISAVFQKRRLDDAALEELEDVLISADLGTEVARRVIESFRRSRFGKEVTDEEISGAGRGALCDPGAGGAADAG